MNTINLLLLVFFLAYSKQGVSSEQNVEKVQSITNNFTEYVKLVSDCKKEQSFRIMENKANDSIELYDLIYRLLPDESETKSYVSWEATEEINAIKWDDSWKNTNSRHGELSIYTVSDKYKNPWHIYLQGNEEGFSTFDISYSWKAHEKVEIWHNDVIENMFNPKTLTTKTLEKYDDEEFIPGWILYEIKLTGKKVFWIKVDITSSNVKNDVYDIVFYINKIDINK